MTEKERCDGCGRSSNLLKRIKGLFLCTWCANKEEL